MPRPVSSNEPIGLDAAAYSAVLAHLPPPTSATPPPTMPSSIAEVSSSPPASSAASAWWQWDELSAAQAQHSSKDDLNLNMSVEYSLRRQRRHSQLLPGAALLLDEAEADGDAPAAVFGFMDESMKNDGFVPILFDDRATSAAGAQSANQPSVAAAADVSPASAGALSGVSPSSASGASTFQTIASVSSGPSTGKPLSALLDAENGEFVCPCCGVRTAGGMSYHGHVTQCYMARFLNPSRSLPSSPRPEARTVAQAPLSPVLTSTAEASGAPTAASIQSLRECVSQLGLHTRLSMMEAFFRLSRSTATAETTDTPQPFPVEEKLISLLYSPAPQAASPPPHAASPHSHASAYRQSPDIERPFSPSSYSSHPTEHVELFAPHTPLQSPPRSPHTPHTCLTPALHQWGVDEEKQGDPLAAFSLHDGGEYAHYHSDQPHHNHNQYTSAPSSPSPAVKRARALSQPAIPYFDDLHTPVQHYTPQPALSITSPTMRSYSPVQVHTHHHYASPSTAPSSASSSSHLLAPVPISAASRRHSTGTGRPGRQPKSSKAIFQQAKAQQTPSTGGSSYLHTPRSVYDASSLLNVTDDALASPASATTASETKGKRRKRDSADSRL